MRVTEESFTGIVNGTKGVVLGAIKKHLYEHYAHAIDDVAQEVYLRAFRNLVKGGFENRSKLSTWLYVIARNESLRMNSRLKREEHKRDSFFIFNKEEPPNEGGPGPELDETAVEEKIGLLPLKYRSVIMLHYKGDTEKEIAKKLSLPGGTVKSRIFRGRAIMKELICRSGGGI